MHIFIAMGELSFLKMLWIDWGFPLWVSAEGRGGGDGEGWHERPHVLAAEAEGPFIFSPILARAAWGFAVCEGPGLFNYV